jgi:dipeptidyl aminopeptidase/acylaminoacyl peptidase
MATLLAVGAALVATAGPASAVSIPGMVLSSATATLPPELTTLATGKRITYVTTDVNGSLITATGLVMTPVKGKAYRVAAWAHGTTGLADKCTPSTNQDVFWPEARTAIAALLGKGFTVAAPDYPGLGTSQAHPYLIGLSEARSIVDAVKAARNLDSSLVANYVIDGHSQGGQGSLFANQIATAYDGNLVLKGSASIAPVSNAATLAPLIPGTPNQGYLVMGLYGLQAVDSTFSANSVLAPTAKTKTSVLNTACLNEILAAYQNLTASQLLVGGALSDSVIAKLDHWDSPAQTTPTAPILLIQGTADESVPAFLTEMLVEQLQAYAQPVTYQEIDGATHDSAVIASADTVATWLAGRF